MGTHPIFESDFDCLTELKCFLDWLPVSLEDVPSSSKPNLVFCTLHQDGLTPTILLTETCGLVLPFLFASPLLIFSQLQNQKEMVATKEYVALKYATLEESDTLLQMKLKAHRATLAED